MPRLLCLAQAHAARKQPRGAAKAARPATKPGVFTVLDAVPVRLAAHTGVWAALRKHATRQPIIDAEHPGETFNAYVIPIDRLGANAVAAIAAVLAERRAANLAAEKGAVPGDILGRPLDKLFAQEMEWLALRNLLAAALASRAAGRPAPRRKPPARALLLIDA
jgi:hypothetical protein